MDSIESWEIIDRDHEGQGIGRRDGLLGIPDQDRSLAMLSVEPEGA